MQPSQAWQDLAALRAFCEVVLFATAAPNGNPDVLELS